MLEHYSDTLQIDDVCEVLNISPNTAYTLLRTHELAGFKCGKSWLIPKDSLKSFILNRTNTSIQTPQ